MRVSPIVFSNKMVVLLASPPPYYQSDYICHMIPRGFVLDPEEHLVRKVHPKKHTGRKRKGRVVAVYRVYPLLIHAVQFLLQLTQPVSELHRQQG